MTLVLWAVNLLLFLVALAFLPFAVRDRSALALSGIVITGVGFAFATFALLNA